MRRFVLGLCVVLFANLGGTCPAACPPPAGTKFRNLALVEAVNLALRNSGHRIEANGDGPRLVRVEPGLDRLEVERKANQALLNVEVAYWNLWGAYWHLYSREQALRFTYRTFQTVRERHEAGRAAVADVYQARGQYHLFRAQRLQALDRVMEAERQLRMLVGLPVEDGTRLLPSDSPTLAVNTPNWDSSLAEAIQKRPELCLVRQDIKATQVKLLLAKNSLLPDLRLAAACDVTALGTRLAGASPPKPVLDDSTGSCDRDALRGLPASNFKMRQMQLELARDIETLKDQELKVQSYLANYYRRLSLNSETIRAQRAQREAFAEQLRARNELYLAGRETPDQLLESQRFWADALANEYQAIVQYNNALAGWEFAKGAALQRHRLAIAGASAKPATEDVPLSLPAVMTATER